MFAVLRAQAGAALLLARTCTWLNGHLCSEFSRGGGNVADPGRGTGGGGGAVVVSGWRVRAIARWVVWACLWGLVATMSVASVRRNREWSDEESLFSAALAVCPRSAKVQLNMGILCRRRGNYTQALLHLEEALAIDPTYCDAHHWIGATLVNLGEVDRGIELLTRAVDCKWVMTASVEALHRLFRFLLAARTGEDEVARPLVYPACA